LSICQNCGHEKAAHDLTVLDSPCMFADCSCNAYKKVVMHQEDLTTLATTREPGLVEDMRAFFESECLSVIMEREGERQGVWKRSGMKGSAFHVQAKSERIFQAAQRGDIETVMKELPDLINYGIFTGLQAQAENVDGEWPWIG